MFKTQPESKVLIEKGKDQFWRIVARSTTYYGLSRLGPVVLSEQAYTSAKEARPEFNAVMQYRKRKMDVVP